MKDAPVIPDLTLLRPIGRGSYGEVWIARTLTGVYRAVKIVYRSSFEDDRPFLRELDGISRFQQNAGDQPRQLALMHVGNNEKEELFYYVMELADDVERGTDIDPVSYEPHTLKALLERGPSLPAEKVVELAIELARALKGLHDADLIHRDVKPSNIIFVAGAPKIADIGLVSSSDHTLTSLGTPGYSPPEGAGSIRADIYSLGRIIYELMSGRRPSDFPLLPADIESRKDMPVLLELNEVVLRACANDPKDRYAHVGEMLDDLLLVEAGKSVMELFRIRRRLKTLGKWASVAGVAAAVVIAALGVRNYFAVKALAAAEMEARVQAEQNEALARYTSDLNLAQLALNSGDVGIARAALRRQFPEAGTAPDARGLEWHALWSETAGDDTRSLGVPGDPAIEGISISPDRSLLAAQEAGETPGTVLWDLANDTRRMLAPDTSAVGGFTEEGSQLIVGTRDRRVRMVDVRTGEAGPASPELGWLVGRATDGRSVVLGRLAGNRAIFTVWDAPAGEERGRWESADRGTPTRIGAAALSADGSLLALSVFWSSGADQLRELLVWDIEASRPRFRVEAGGVFRALAFSPDNEKLAAGGQGLPLSIYSVEDGAVEGTFAGHAGWATTVGFSPDGRRLASAGSDQKVRLYDTAAANAIARTLVGHESVAEALIWTSNAMFFTGGADGTIRQWNVGSPERVRSRPGYWSKLLGDLIFGPDQKSLFVTDEAGNIVRVNPETLLPEGKPLPAFHPLGFANDRLRALSDDLELVTIDPTDGQIESTGLRPGSTGTVLSIAASKDAGLAILGFSDGTIELWNNDQALRLSREQPHETAAQAVAISVDGSKAASGDRRGVVHLWNPPQGRLDRAFEDSNAQVTALALTPDGGLLAVGRVDGSVTLLDTETLAVAARIQSHTRAVESAAFTADGSRIVTGGLDGLLIVSRTQGGRQLATLTLDPSAGTATNRNAYRTLISADSRRIFVLTEDGWLRAWNGAGDGEEKGLTIVASPLPNQRPAISPPGL